MEALDHSAYASREDRILQTTLKDFDTVLERNPFPYDCPQGVHHFTLWCRWDMDEREIEEFVQKWLEIHSPCARQWIYDENESRSIDLFHVHVYIEGEVNIGGPVFPQVRKRANLEEDETIEEPSKRRKCLQSMHSP